jgi:hypothetical protein
LLSEIERLVDLEHKDHHNDLTYSATVLLAGYVFPEAMRAEYRAFTERRNARQTEELPSGEPQNLEWRIRALEQAFELVKHNVDGRLLGRVVDTRIRFLTG